MLLGVLYLIAFFVDIELMAAQDVKLWGRKRPQRSTHWSLQMWSLSVAIDNLIVQRSMMKLMIAAALFQIEVALIRS